MRKHLGKSARWLLSKRGLDLVPKEEWGFSLSEYPEATDRDREILRRVQPITMTTEARIWGLISAVKYVVNSEIPGAFVECGVWRGGSVAAMLLTLQDLGDTNREVWLFDTFEGMVEPTPRDVESATGSPAAELLSSREPSSTDHYWAIASRSDVESNIAETGYPSSRLVWREGDVCRTLQDSKPEKIALLRLDTDWYESTKCELENLWPALQPRGVCIIDDYGHWEGARLAVDEFLASLQVPPMLIRLDYGARLLVKP